MCEPWCNHDAEAVRGGRCECGVIVERDKMVARLTRRQREAYRDLEAGRKLWPLAPGWMSASGPEKYSKRTLVAIETAGLATMVYQPGVGVMPYWQLA